MSGRCRWLSWAALWMLLAGPARAWGPHGEITRAAVAALPAGCALRAELGERVRDLESTCWMGDWRSSVHPDYFPDDYLLFPAAPRHFDHLVPDVRGTYPIFFRRALQALRHETPANAARWVGSLLHFVEDSGSPPHAAEIRGELHSRMENWLDASAIHLPGYQPRLLGTDETAALTGFLDRMEGLIAYSRERAERMRDAVAALAERANQPLSLECALETARVTADVLLTLGERARSPQGGATLKGRVTWPATRYLPDAAARVALLGTDWATGTEAGSYEFRHLPPGRYQVSVLRPGSAAVIAAPISLSEGETRTVDVTLPAPDPAENMLRNPEFALRWVRPDAPDCWRKLPARAPAPGWESDNVAVRPGGRYRVGAELLPGQPVTLAVRWRGHAVANQEIVERRLAGPAGEVVTAPPTAKYLQVLLLTDREPASACRRVWCLPADPAAP